MSRTAPPIRLAAFDLDGTLLGPGVTLAETTVRSVAGLIERGIMVAIVTGRMPLTAERYALALGLEGQPLVSYNGAAAKEVGGGGLWWHVPVAPALAVKVLSFLGERGLEPLVFSGDHVYAAAPSERLERYGLISGVTPEYVGDLRVLVTGAGDDRVAGSPDPLPPTKILQVEAEDMPPLFAAARARFGARLNVTTSYAYFLEFMNRRVSKAWGLARVCRRLGVAREEVAAFGDGLNDLDMIEWAGLGVAMRHGPAPLLAAARRVIDGPPGEGVARFLEENFLAPTAG